jgi:hypothetical protein
MAAGEAAEAAAASSGSSARYRRRVVARIGTLLPPLAFAVAGAALAAYQPADAAVETSYLTLVGACALAGAALLAGMRAREQAAAAVLAMLALWSLSAGPARGIALGIVLVAALLLAAWRRLRVGTIDATAAVGGALGLHALLRASELLPAALATSGPAALARLLVPPLLAGLALAFLARRRPLGGVLAAGAAVALAAQGFTVTGALPLLAIAAVDAATAWRARDGGTLDFPSLVRNVDLVAAVGFGLAALLLTAMRPASGALALAAASLGLLPRLWAWPVAVAPLVYALATHFDAQQLLAVTTLVMLLPFAFLPRATPIPRLVGAVLVGAAGALLLPTPAGLAGAAAALVLSLDEASVRASLQRGWLGILFALAALAASYPWLRPAPLHAALTLLGAPAADAAGGIGRIALLIAAVLLGAAMLSWLAAWRAAPRGAAALFAFGVAIAVLAALPRPARNVAPDAIALRGDVPEWSTALRESSVSRVRVVSSLADSAVLPAGTAVATLALERDGRPLAAWTLRAGKDTAEWAADRPDLRHVAAAGPIWWSWLPPPGTFFAHAYASTWKLSRPVPATVVRVVRDPALPPAVTVSLLRVEVSQ